MQTTHPQSRLPSDQEQEALICLLADEDPGVHATVRERILSYGQDACIWLRNHTLSPDPVVRQRTREILHVLCRQESNDQFLSFCHNSGEDLDLEEATGLLAQTQYADTNREGYQALYDDWAGELKTRINFSWNPKRILRTVNDFFFKELGFSGNEHYNYLPECCYLNRVVDSRSGNPISLCALYLFIARRLCLPITGIGLPGHFVCRYQSSTQEIYLDVFRGGRFLNRADCIRFLVQSCHEADQGFLAPVSSRRMLSRMCANLHQTYSQLEMVEQATRIQRYLIALAR